MGNYISKILSSDRNPILDLFRAIAVLLVVQVHYFINFPEITFYNFLIEGNIGVDIFFVLSGYLVSRTLLKQMSNHQSIGYKTFYLKRIFKILPSFYFAVLASYLLYNFTALFPTLYFDSSELIYYFTFTQNYSGSTILYHAWSLCVEEHFYIFLPIGLMLFSKLFGGNTKYLLGFFTLTVLFGYVFRYVSFQLDYETYASTHNRIDAIILGVILALLELRGSKWINKKHHLTSTSKLWLLLGIMIFFSTLCIQVVLNYQEIESSLFSQVLYHGLIPFSIFIILSQCLNLRIKLPGLIKLSAYFSYNWYLWHYILVQWFVMNIESTTLGIIIFTLSSFIVSALVTYLIEEPFMRLRKKVIVKVQQSA